MAITPKTGLVALVQIMKHGCRLLTKFRPTMNAAIAAAVTDGLITSTQSTTLQTFLDSFTAACDILRIITGY